jgi:hypothetical protein
MLAASPALGFGIGDRLACPQCHRIMRLTRRTPDPERGVAYELQTFACARCGCETRRCVDEQGVTPR